MKTKALFKEREIFEKPFLLFSPFLILAVIFVIITYDPSFFGDESKYLNFATNILHGYYSPPAPKIYLATGPGYPLILVPFVAFKIPYIGIALLNAFFYYISIVFLYKALKHIVTLRLALIISLFWAFYYNSYENLQYILSESVAPFLISAIMYFLVRMNDSATIFKNKYIYLAGFTLGYLALTKIIFGYVLLFMFAGNCLVWLFNRSSINYRKGLIVLTVAFLTTLPYLVYTYHLTGKVFYWGSVGGNNMYWMSTPYEKEYGSWFPEPKRDSDSIVGPKTSGEFRLAEHNKLIIDGQNIPGYKEYVWYNHHSNFAEINKYKGVEKDEIFKRIAINNIREHPVKYLENCMSNLGRILFNYPYTYKLQNPGTLIRIPPNGIILTLLLLSLYSTILNWKKIIFAIRFSIFLFLLYMGASITGSAEIRMFTVIVPILLLWIAYVLQRTLKVNFRFDEVK